MIYILEPGKQQTSYSEEQARALWNQRSISQQAYYWKEGMPDWRPAWEFFAASEAMTDAPPTARGTGWPPGLGKDPTKLTRFLKIMLQISTGLAVVGALVAVISLATGNAARSSEEGLTVTDALEALVGLVQMVVYVATGVPFLMWIHRANRNARALGAQGMEFTPGWSVGWYFIPILNLWKPYRAMKELWQASQNPRSWRTQAVAPVVSRWWTLWLVTNFLGQMSLRLMLRAQTPQALVSAEVMSLLSDLTDVALCLTAIWLVTSIYQKQTEWAQGPA